MSQESKLRESRPDLDRRTPFTRTLAEYTKQAARIALEVGKPKARAALLGLLKRNRVPGAAGVAFILIELIWLIGRKVWPNVKPKEEK